MNIPPKMQPIVGGLLATGIPFVLLEARGCKPESINYTSKVDGKKASFSYNELPCETLGESSKQVSVRLDLPKGSTLAADGRVLNDKGEPVPSPFKKGDKVLVVVKGIETKMGQTKIQAIQVEPWSDK